MLFTHCRSQELSEQARTFLATLGPELKKAVQRPFQDDQRASFHYIPMARPGPTFHDFNTQQKKAALALLRASLSQSGYGKATGVMELEKILYQLENQTNEEPPANAYRDPLNYHFLVFGQPAGNAPWGWKIEGHHVSFSFTAATGSIVSSTPAFLGTNPAVVSTGPQKGKEILKDETELGFKLVNALSPAQLAKARFSETAPREIMTGNQRKVQALEPLGISRKALNPGQQKILDALINTFLGNFEADFEVAFRAKIEKAGWDNIAFAWAGALEPGKGHYYRIQNPAFLVEYDNTQNNANHVHTVVRDLTNDFGEDHLKAHYQHDH